MSLLLVASPVHFTVIAEKAAQIHRAFALDLLVLVQRAVREHETIAKNLEALCADPAEGADETNE